MGLALVEAAAARPGSGSPCSTPATSARASGEPAEGVAGALLRRRRATRWADAGRGPATARDGVAIGAAVHSVRAVPRRRRWRPSPTGPRGPARSTCTCPSRSPRTRPASRRTAAPPPQVLADHGVLGPLTTAVHATHLTDDDVAAARRRRRRTPASARPPSATSATASARRRRLHDAGAPADPRQRQPRGGRPLRGDARRRARRAAAPPSSAATGRAAELLAAATGDGHAASGWADAGAIAVGQRADLVTLDTARARARPAPAPTRTPPSSPPPPRTSRHVMVDGRVVFRQGDRRRDRARARRRRSAGSGSMRR